MVWNNPAIIIRSSLKFLVGHAYNLCMYDLCRGKFGGPLVARLLSLHDNVLLRRVGWAYMARCLNVAFYMHIIRQLYSAHVKCDV